MLEDGNKNQQAQIETELFFQLCLIECMRLVINEFGYVHQGKLNDADELSGDFYAVSGERKSGDAWQFYIGFLLYVRRGALEITPYFRLLANFM